MKSKAKFTASPALVVWLPTFSLTLFAICWAATLSNSFNKLALWAGYALMAILLSGVVVSAIITIRRHEALSQPGWLHILNTMWLAIAILWLLWLGAQLWLTVSWLD